MKITNLIFGNLIRANSTLNSPSTNQIQVQPRLESSHTKSHDPSDHVTGPNQRHSFEEALMSMLQSCGQQQLHPGIEFNS